MMTRLRDSSEIKEAAALLAGLLGEQGTGRFREAKLERAIGALCERAGFASAALVDDRGLPVASHGVSLPTETIAAFTTILGDALVRACGLLGRGNATSLSIELDYANKAFVRRFVVHDAAYLLIAFCAHEVDAHAEIELSVEPLAELLR